MKSVSVKAICGSKVVDVQTKAGRKLSRVLLEAGFPINLYCGGHGVCGRCFIEIKGGKLQEEGPEEKRFRRERKLPENFRLVCRLVVTGPITVRIPENVCFQQEVLPSSPSGVDLNNIARIRDFNPPVKKYFFRFQAEDLASADSLIRKIDSTVKLNRLRFYLYVQPKAISGARWLRRCTAVVDTDSQALLNFEPGDTGDRIFGLAVDLGTTTISAALVSLTTGKILAEGRTLNSQAKYGSDVISRVSFAVETPGNLDLLRREAVDSVERLISELTEKAGIKRKWVYAVSLAGNTVMNHIFLGYPVHSLSRSPFKPVFLRMKPLTPDSTRLRLNPFALTYFSPNIDGFVGGDISAGLLYTGLLSRSGNFLLVDLGTNGEIVLKCGDTLLAASTAAGPAFEGGGISCGLPAVPGAIEKIVWKNGRFFCRAIPGAKPSGICGSGLIGAISESLKAGLIEPSGKIKGLKGGQDIIKITSGVALTQLDIRKLQLAMASIKSGVTLLLRQAGMSWTELDGIYLAGVFGNSVEAGQCVFSGLLPPLPLEKIFYVGNASLAGATMMLLSRTARKEIEQLARKVKHISLAENKDFQPEFLRALAVGSQYWRSQDD
ncbi:MAG: ASKHA domain-containing protein [Candidatus Saccharicenans sp.]